jgi:hypothetical protein
MHSRLPFPGAIAFPAAMPGEEKFSPYASGASAAIDAPETGFVGIK